MSEALVLGTRKGLLVFDRSGSGWARRPASFSGDPVSYAVNDPRTDTLWACLSYGHWGCKMHRSTDGGANWQEVEAPKYPEGAVLKDDKPATLEYLWTLDPGPADRQGLLWAGTIRGGLFKSEDDGASWHIVESLWDHPTRKEQWFGGGFDQPGVHSILVDPRNSDHVMVGISCAGVFHSADAGSTWEIRNKGLRASFLPDPEAEVGHDPHLIAFSAADPDIIWQQNHDGIYSSRDGAGSWQVHSAVGDLPHFGFAVATDSDTPDTAWVVPATSDQVRVAVNGALTVARTDDGGSTWTAFRDGLPQEECWDFAFRHALDVDGDTLAFGTACGSVYVSEDRGETWKALGHHFPPVYSVRFWRE